MDQAIARDRVMAWVKRPDKKQVFRLFGVAGTGKTTLARSIADSVDGRVMFAAFTGKAAHVLRKMGCPATTIHKLIYQPSERSTTTLRELESALSDCTHGSTEFLAIQRKIQEERRRLRQPVFTRREESELRGAALLIVDECSMVDERIGRDLESYGVPILVLGDPAQLPPVRGCGYFTEQTPDLMLTEIHRQALNNPIIRLATRVRMGEPIAYGEYGPEARVIESGVITPDEVRSADQIIVGTNRMRTVCNRRMRELLGYSGQCVIVGDRLVCLRNDHEVGVLNGSQWRVNEVYGNVSDRVSMSIRSLDSGVDLNIDAHAHPFEGRGDEIPWWARKEALEFDYGYALTCHRSQGSEWDNVIVFDESRKFPGSRTEWLYTAITRAKRQLTIVR